MHKKEKIPILIVEDEIITLMTLKNMLVDFMGSVDTASNAETARKNLKKKEYGIIICDDRLPGESGLDLLKTLKKDFPDTVKILLTAFKDFDRLKTAINEADIFKYISKPVNINEILNIVDQASKMYLLKKNEKIYIRQLSEKNLQLIDAYEILKKDFDHSINIILHAVEEFDSYLGSHAIYVQKLSELIAEEQNLPEEEIDNIRYAAVLHDIGLIGISREAIQDYQKVEEGDPALTKEHPVIGATILGKEHNFIRIGRLIRHHHEKFNGTGYPDKLKGGDIPIGSRIIAIADFTGKYLYDIICRKENMSLSNLSNRLISESKTRFDPELVDSTIKLINNKDFKLQYILRLPSKALMEDLLTAMPLHLQSGTLFLPKDTLLDEEIIKEIQRLSKTNYSLNKIFVYYDWHDVR